jgi:hypothetical protein
MHQFYTDRRIETDCSIEKKLTTTAGLEPARA